MNDTPNPVPPSPEGSEPIYVGPIRLRDLPERAETYVRLSPENMDNLDLLDDDTVWIRLQADPGTEKNIQVESGVSMFDGHPFITLRWGNEKAQFSPEEMRAHALSLIECSVGAENDALVARGMTRGGFDKAATFALIAMMRDERAIGWQQRNEEPPASGLIVP